MEKTPEIERYFKNPNLLLQILRDVIEVLESDDQQGEKSAMEAQLKEISKAMQKLEKINVIVPDVLRGEKTRLAAALETQSKSMRELIYISNEMTKLLKDLNIYIGQGHGSKSSKRVRRQRSHLPRTENALLREYILDALNHLGGAGRKIDVLKYMDRELEGKLLPGDLSKRESSGEYAWRNNAAWERFRMIKDGVLKSGSPTGIWELSEGHK
jgi:hypothetical protein